MDSPMDDDSLPPELLLQLIDEEDVVPFEADELDEGHDL